MKRYEIRLAFVLLAAMFCLSSAFGQTAATGALSGTITDPSGAVVPNATVTITSLATGQLRTATSGGDGSYKVGLLAPGEYRIRFEAAGFRTTEVPSVTVTVAETGTLNQSLAVGAQTQEVTVDANVETVQTANAAVGSVIAGHTVTDLPLNTRNYTNLLSLTAGTAAAVQNAATVGKGTQGISTNGAASYQNNYQMDGASILNQNSGLVGIGGEHGPDGFIGIPNPDSIQEFKIQTSQYDAGYGRTAGANVNVVTKSGTNSFHGTFWEFARNTALNANDFFLNHSAKPKGILNQNQYGTSLGGPIKKDKLFFFLSFQETEQRNGLSSSGLATPTLPAIPTGDRGTTNVESASTPWLSAMYAKYCGMEGVNGTAGSAQIRAPQFGPTAGACTNTGYAAARAVANLNPVAINILQFKNNGQYFVPSINGGAGGATAFSFPATYKEHQAMLNSDYVLSPKNTFSERYFYSIDPTHLPFSGGSLPGGSPSYGKWSNHEAVLKLTSLLSSSLVNEARVSYQRNITNSQESSPITPAAVGMTPLSPISAQYFPQTTVAGFGFGNGVFNVVLNTINQFQIADQLSLSRGKHTIRVGGEAGYYQWNWFFPALAIGTISYTTFPDFLMGLPGCAPSLSAGACAASSIATPGLNNGTFFSNEASSGPNSVRPNGINGVDQHYRTFEGSGFFQDDLKLSSRLTVNFGLRWEYDGFTYERNGLMTNMSPTLARLGPPPGVSTPCTTGVACPGSSYIGYVVPRNYCPQCWGPLPGGVFTSNQKADPANGAPLDLFAPRFGFAWQPTHNGRLVVRGGGGFFYQMPPGETWNRSADQAPPYNVPIGQTGANNFAQSLAQPFAPTAPTWVARWIVTTPGQFFGQSSNIAQQSEQRNFKIPTTYQYGLQVQYEFIHNWVAELGYSGAHGIHQQSGDSVNPAVLASASNPVNCGYNGGTPTNVANCITTSAVNNVNLRVPALGLASSGWFDFGSDGSYKYDSLEATLRKTLSHGLRFEAAYTWSRALATPYGQTGNYFGVNATYPLVSLYGPNALYRPQRLTVNYTYDLPFKGSGLAGKFVGGWAVSGVVTIQDGDPLTVSDSRLGTVFGSPVSSTAEYAPGMSRANAATSGSTYQRVVSGFCTTCQPGTGFLNTAAFCAPSNVTGNACLPVTPQPGGAGNGFGYGNAGLGIVLGPGQHNWDISVSKMTRVGGLREDASLELRAEFFNAFNHPQFSDPAVAFNNLATFGHITSTSVNPRLIQFAAKYVF